MNKVLSILAALLLVVSCSSSEPSFKGKEYQMIQAQNGADIMLGFDMNEDRFFGKVVNNFFGGYKLDGEKISFGPAGATMMMGPADLMEAEMNFLQILPKVVSYHFVDKTLVLVTDNGQEIAFKEIVPAPQQ